MSQLSHIKNESIEHLWLLLDSLWRNTRPHVPPAAQAEIYAIDDLIKKRTKRASGADDWTRVNEAELRIGALLSAGRLYTQFLELIGLAVARDLPSRDLPSRARDLAKHEHYFKEPPTAPCRRMCCRSGAMPMSISLATCNHHSPTAASSGG